MRKFKLAVDMVMVGVVIALSTFIILPVIALFRGAEEAYSTYTTEFVSIKDKIENDVVASFKELWNK